MGPGTGSDPGVGAPPERLDATETLSWAWDVLTERLDLVGAVFVVAVVSLLADLTMTVQQTPSGPMPAPTPLSSVLNLVYLVGFLLVTGMIAYAAQDAVRGERRDLADLFSPALSRALWLFLTLFAFGIVVFLGLIALVLPGLYLLVRLLLAIPAAVVDERGPIESLKASWVATDDNFLKVGGLVLANILASLVVGVVASLVVGPASGVVTSSVLTPLFGFAYTRVYLENRPEPAPESGSESEPAPE